MKQFLEGSDQAYAELFAQAALAFLDALQQLAHRHLLVADGKSSPHRTQSVRHPRCRIEPEGRSAGQDQRIDLLHQPVGRQEIGFAGARAAAAHVACRDTGLVADNDGDAGQGCGICGAADRQARHVGEIVVHAANMAEAGG